MSQSLPKATETGRCVQLPPEPQSIGQFLADGHPWMALIIALAWLKPVRLGSLVGVGFLLSHLLR